jgi:hypothetical protein
MPLNLENNLEEESDKQEMGYFLRAFVFVALGLGLLASFVWAVYEMLHG